MYGVTQMARRWNDQGEWPGPAARSEPRGERRQRADVISDLLDVARNQRERLIGRALLQREDLGDGGSGPRIDSETVERLGWKSDDAAILQRADRRSQIFRGYLRRRNTQMNHAYFDSRYWRYGAVDIGRPVMRRTRSRG